MSEKAEMNVPQERRPGFFSSMVFSAVSFQFYRRIKDQTFGRTLRYLLFLAAIISLAVGLRLTADFTRALSDWSAWLLQNFPAVQVKNGIASTVPPEGKRLEDARAIVILQPETAPVAIEEKYKAGLILQKEKVLLKWNQAAGLDPQGSRLETLVYAVATLATLTMPERLHGGVLDLAGIRSLVLDDASIRQWEALTRRWVRITLPGVYFIFYLAGKLMQALFFSLVLAYSHRTMRESGFGFANALNIAVYALTPPALFAAALQLLGVQVPLLEWVFLGMYVAFLLGAIGACVPKKASPAPEDQESGPGNWDDF